MDKLLSQAVSVGELRQFDIQFAKYITEANGGKPVDELTLAAALTSYRLSLGDTCLNLDKVSAFGLYTHPDIDTALQKLPSVRKWRDLLQQQSVVQVVPDDGDQPEISAPLVLDKHNRLYLSRYWRFEQMLLSVLRGLMSTSAPVVDSTVLTRQLNHVFKKANDQTSETDWQKVAAAVAAINRFCVITGGPGTGKTYTVAAVLSILQALQVDEKVKVALAAPTGKAAARLTESLLNSEVVPAAFKDLEALTLHRLLGLVPGRITPRYHSGNPLPHDVLIIDEASMIDLPMMVRALSAVSDDTRVILLGDKDQLASVESGMVLGDICGLLSETRLSQQKSSDLLTLAGIEVTAHQGPLASMSDHIVYLTRSRRSNDQSGISELSRAINSGDADTCLTLFESDQYPDLRLFDHSHQHIDEALRAQVVPAYQSISALGDPAKALEQMRDVCVLCALKRGRSGADGINLRVRNMLQELGDAATDSENYRARPVMITENSTSQNLFNGDFGIVWEHEETLKVCFPGESGVRAIAPSRLPRHDTFYAMTVHKSQGSEYGSVIIILPESDSPLLTRELLYTAVTRAREKVSLIANREQLISAVVTRSQRQSGLLSALWPGAVRTVEKPAKRPIFDGSPEQTELDF